MKVGVAYAEPDHQEWIEFEVPEGTTAQEAIRTSGIQERFPHADLESKKMGIFGKPVKADQELREGDRVEIYRPLQVDPKKGRTRQSKKKGGDQEEEGDSGE